MEDASGEDLDWFWRGWFYSIDNTDISIDTVKYSKADVNGTPARPRDTFEMRKLQKPDVNEYEDTSFEKFSGTDRFVNEPSWQFLINSEKVILTPHIAGWTFESHKRISEVLYEKIVDTIRKI